MQHAASEADFDRLSWHDNHIYGLALSMGDIERGDWRSDLVLDIDHIVEWVCGADRTMLFRVAPATLTFHHVTDLTIALAWPDSLCRVAPSAASIAAIAREPVADQQICFDRPYYRWRIATNWPPAGAIAFGASGFSQRLRREPVLIEEQKLSPAGRTPIGR